MRIHRSRMERVMDTQSHEDSLGIVVADKTTQQSLRQKRQHFSLYLSPNEQRSLRGEISILYFLQPTVHSLAVCVCLESSRHSVILASRRTRLPLEPLSQSLSLVE